MLVCDVGHAIEVYADFRRMGKYEQFPDRQGFRIYLEDLRDPAVRERLRCIWLDPHSLDPTRRSAKATREIAGRLAQVSKSLEKTHAPEEVAHFLMRCLFTMFAEDVDLLPEASFQGLLADCVDNPSAFAPLLADLWRTMDTGGFAPSIRTAVKRFNGALFKDAHVIPLGREEIGELLAAAKANWTEVEPAIFGALLEQALEPGERKKLGAHYTPRAYVERLVTATIIEPLRADWSNVLAAVETRRAEGDAEDAVALVRAFHDRLCETRVLDPACGTGNFLYVSLDLMKRLEAEVLQTLADLGGQEALSLEGHTVDPHQFLGLELNPRAAAIAELVLWIGYLQLHFKTKGGPPGEPILRAFGNINFGKPGGYDAVLTWDGYPVPKVVREGGEARETYPRARQPKWPDAEFIVGNPPFIGTRRLKERQGDKYVTALRDAYVGVARTADYVMYWYFIAGTRVANGKTRGAGLITTNSIVQDYSRPVLESFISGDTPSCRLAYAVTNHPWVDPDRGAAIRVAMTVLVSSKARVRPRVGTIRNPGKDDTLIEHSIERINASLRPIPDVFLAQGLDANELMCFQGVVPANEGFKFLAKARAVSSVEPTIMKPYMIGNDLNDVVVPKWIIDTNEMSQDDLRSRYPNAYQHLRELVYPARQKNPRKAYRDRWWRFAESRPALRAAINGLSKYIATPYTAQHRTFQFWSSDSIPDAMVYCIPSEDGSLLAELSSVIHATWCKYCGGTLETRPRYNSRRTFLPFPFADPDEALKIDLRAAGERLDAFRKERQAEHPRLTLTQMYNVREAIRAGRALTPEEARIKDEALVLILNERHDEIDALTLQAYGWPQGLTDEEIVARLVALNAERAAEERRGQVRWLRPDYQKARAGVATLGGEQTEADLEPMEFKSAPESFPRDPVEQSAAVAAALADAPGPLAASSIAARWRKDKRTERKVEAILAAFVRTGAAHSPDGGQTFRARRAA